MWTTKDVVDDEVDDDERGRRQRWKQRRATLVEPQILVSYFKILLFFTILTSINRLSTQRRQETTGKGQVGAAGPRDASSPKYR